MPKVVYGNMDPSNRLPWPGDPTDEFVEVKRDAWDLLGIEIIDEDIRRDK